MSMLINKEPKSDKQKWSIGQTEFLLRLIMSSQISGSDLDVAHQVVQKIKSIHSELMETKVDG